LSREEVYEKLNPIFQDCFDDSELIVNDETVAGDVEGWDSLEHINLIFSVETSFGIKFTMDEALHLQKVGDMVDMILQKLG